MRITEGEFEASGVVIARDILRYPMAARLDCRLVSAIASIGERDARTCTTASERRILRAALETIEDMEAVEIASWGREMPP